MGALKGLNDATERVDLIEDLRAEIRRLRGRHERDLAAMADKIERLRAAINEATNSLAAIGQTDNAAYRRLKNLDEQEMTNKGFIDPMNPDLVD